MGFLVYEQRLSMYWFSVWISGGSLMESVHPSSHAWDVHVIIGCFHTKGWTNRRAFVLLMWIYVVLSLTYSSRWANRLRKIIFIRRFVRPVCTSDDLFVWDDSAFQTISFKQNDLFVWDDLAFQTICLSASVKLAIILHFLKLGNLIYQLLIRGT